MRLRLSGAMFLLILLIFSSQVYGRNYSKHGKFRGHRPLSYSQIFADYEDRDLKALDQRQHFNAFYLSQKFLSRHLNKYFSSGVVEILSILRDYEDSLREGWNQRKLFADFFGILAGIYSNHKYKLLYSYENEKITLNLLLAIDF